MAGDKIRPTKKQLVLLAFIDEFIIKHGYSPSYREIMTGLQYNSVATVALHVKSLIARGHLVKRGRSARSLEVVFDGDFSTTKKLVINTIAPTEEKWLVEKIQQRFARLEQEPTIGQSELDELFVLVGALKILGVEGAHQAFIPRLTALKPKAVTSATPRA
jgi:SOS-response transcriptional repressor LexA